ncbi:MAG TPA: hypothetical protein VFP46_01780 [Candidatus Paceibacterota bacterium]|nr:hypothetical protein [Candidatus Paceibacterota bacterium]
MAGKGIVTVLGILILIGIGWYFLAGNTAQAPSVVTQVNENTNQTAATTSQQTAVQQTASTTPSGTTVTYTDQGFSPASISVRSGTKVTFVNQSSGQMWVASGVHPTHSIYSGTTLSQHCPDTAGTAFDECSSVGTGGTYTFTFAKVGTWKYHNHVNAGDFGSVTVTAK